MEVIDELLEKQQQQARKWDVLLDEKEVKPVSVVAGTKPNYWVYGVLAENKRAFMEEWRLKAITYLVFTFLTHITQFSVSSRS